MNPLIAGSIIAGAVWLSVLTLLMLLSIRQIGILTVRLSLPDGKALLAHDGPNLGIPVPTEALRYLPELESHSATLLLISSHCTPCRDLVVELSNRRLDHRVITLLAGREALADDLAALLPSNFYIVRDPEATAIAEILTIQSSPFTVAFENGKVIRKSYIHSIDGFVDFVKHSAQNKAADLILPMEAHHVN